MTPETLEVAVEPVIRGLGLDLYDLELTGTPRSRCVRITLDGPNGVDLETIALVSQAVAPVLDNRTDLLGHYTLEVSSPGLERALRKPRHFKAAIDTTVSLKVRDAQGHAKHINGMLTAATDDNCTVVVDGTEQEFSYVDVLQARTVFEWGMGSKTKRSNKNSHVKERKAS